jgi:chaperonin cofactor prefoldin
VSYTFESILKEAERMLQGDTKAGAKRFKELQQAWKELCRASREQHQRFRAVGDSFFSNLREAREDAALEYETRQKERAEHHVSFVKRTAERIEKLEASMKRTEDGMYHSEDRLKELEMKLQRANERLRDTYGMFGKKPLRGNSDHKQREEYVGGLEERVYEIRHSIQERRDRLQSMREQHRVLREKLRDAESNKPHR